jgi:hypothetical protein
MQVYGGVELYIHHSELLNLIEVTGQMHASATIASENSNQSGLDRSVDGQHSWCRSKEDE